MTILPQEVLPDKTNLRQDTEERLSDGLRILARIIARCHIDRNRRMCEGIETSQEDMNGSRDTD